jgi:hypothetical protein
LPYIANDAVPATPKQVATMKLVAGEIFQSRALDSAAAETTISRIS